MTWEECMETLGVNDWYGCKMGLQPTRNLLKKCGNPENNLRFIHIAGSNGKGSVAKSLQQILSLSGYKTGMYISPHIEIMNERYTIDGEMISDEDLKRLCLKMRELSESLEEEKPNSFEMLTALAFCYFLEKGVDYVVLEVGLGGRLDATNVIPHKELSVIAHIGLEHTAILGDTLEEIAREKGGIIAKDTPVVLMHQKPEVMEEIRRICKEKNAKLHITNPKYFHSYSFHIDNGYQYFSYRERQEYALSLLGDYQLDNAMVICDAIDCLKERGISIPEDCVKQGLMTVTWPGRFEILKKRPLIILDGAHNPQAVNSLVRSIEMLFPNYKKRIFFSVMADKDYMTMLELLKTNTLSFSFFQVETHRGQSPEILKKEWQEHFSGEIYCPNTLEEGLEWNLNAVKKEEEKTLLLCLGSLYQVGQIRNFFRNYYSSH